MRRPDGGGSSQDVPPSSFKLNNLWNNGVWSEFGIREKSRTWQGNSIVYQVWYDANGSKPRKYISHLEALMSVLSEEAAPGTGQNELVVV